MRSTAKILLVDDEPKLLSALRRQLVRKFDVVTAESGAEALSKIEELGPFSVVVSDMRMPEMDGVEFLHEVRAREPEITRIMLTGNADQETAMEAVNRGSIYRFLRKPCAGHVLSASIEDGIQEYQRKREFEAFKAKPDESRQVLVGLFAHMSHELRTPLNHILGFAQLLEHVGAGDEQCREYASHIQRSGADLLGILTNILVLGETKYGDVQLSRSPLSLNKLIGDCRDHVESLGAEKKVSFETIVAPHFPDLFVEPEAFMHILVNLLSNAVKFNKADGAIRLRVGFDAAGNPQIEISDTGIGIAPEHLSQVVEPFGSADEVHSRSYDGVGIGLPLAKTLTELHGGTLLVDSEFGEGTTVTVCLTPDSIQPLSGPAASDLSSPRQIADHTLAA